ncbi:MAG: zinc-binding dehydrogenase, partial [Elainella sp.]
TNLAVLNLNSTIATYASDSDPQPQFPVYTAAYKNLTIHTVLVYVMPASAYSSGIADITACLETRTLRHLIAHRYGLEEIAAAHEMQESGEAIGKLVIDRVP